MYGKPNYDDEIDLREVTRATLVRVVMILVFLLLGAAFPKMMAGLAGGTLWIMFSTVGWILP